MKSHKEFKAHLVRLGDLIYRHRVLKNYSTKQIAPLLSLTPEAYRNIEKGESDPSVTTLLLISKVLGMDCSELIKSLSV